MVLAMRCARVWGSSLRALSSAASSDLVRQLRQKTGAPIIKCKQALEAEGGDLTAAAVWLRKSGVATAQKKSGRGAHEGVVGVLQDSPTRASIIELNSETDFVARNSVFQELADAVARTVAASSDGDGVVRNVDVAALGSATLAGGCKSVTDGIVDAVATLGENVKLRRAALVSAPGGVVAHYVHNAYTPRLGRTACVVALAAGDGAALGAEQRHKLQETAQRLAMHVVAANPKYISREDIPQAVIDQETAVQKAQLAGSNKPPEVVEKIVAGKLTKYAQEVSLLNQEFVLDSVGSVKKLLDKVGKEVGSPVKVSAFVKYHLGEGQDDGEGDAPKE